MRSELCELRLELLKRHVQIRLRSAVANSGRAQEAAFCSQAAKVAHRVMITCSCSFCFFVHFARVSTVHMGPRVFANAFMGFSVRSPSYTSPSLSGGLKYLPSCPTMSVGFVVGSGWLSGELEKWRT